MPIEIEKIRFSMFLGVGGVFFFKPPEDDGDGSEDHRQRMTKRRVLKITARG